MIVSVTTCTVSLLQSGFQWILVWSRKVTTWGEGGRRKIVNLALLRVVLLLAWGVPCMEWHLPIEWEHYHKGADWYGGVHVTHKFILRRLSKACVCTGWLQFGPLSMCTQSRNIASIIVQICCYTSIFEHNTVVATMEPTKFDGNSMEAT